MTSQSWIFTRRLRSSRFFIQLEDGSCIEKNVFMDISSEPDQGTKVTIRIPVESGDKKNVECFDC